MSEPEDSGDPYAVLEVPENADAETIRDAYRRMAQQYHPDKVGHLGPEIRAVAERKMRAINAAYDTLSDPNKRQAYDARRQPTPDAATAPRPSAAKVWEAYVAAARTDEPSRRTVRLFAALGVVILVLIGLLWYRTRNQPSTIETAVSLTFAREYLANGQPEEALTLLQRITEASANDLIAWNLRWQTETRLGLYADAEGSLTRAVELDPSNPRLRVEYAKALFRRGKVEETRAQLAWLGRNDGASAVIELLEAFRRENPALAKRLMRPGESP
jgi:curved DNA-binding protein CbpA